MPADPGTGYAQALALSEAGEPAAALALLAPLLGGTVRRFEVLALAAALHERLEQYERALALYEQLLAQHGRQVGLCIAIGRVRALMHQPAAALSLFDEALVRQPQNPEALYNRGNALRLLFRREEAIEAYRAVLPLHADYARMALLDIAQQQQALLDFDAARISYLQHFITAGGTVESIGYRLCNEHYAWPQDPAGIAALARQLGNQYAAQASLPVLPPAPPRTPGQRLRIGLVSADLWSHPVGYFIEALLGAAVAREVDWFVYHNRAPKPDAVTQRLRAHVSVWRDVLGWLDERLARQIRQDGIDVLVDLSGYSLDHRLAMFVARPAPLQLSWLGFHGTTGLPYIDGVIADPVCVRAGEDHFFTEPLLRLPHTRLCYTPPPDAPPVAPAPVLRQGAITFGCFQHAVKIGPQVLAAWARIAAALPEARWVVGVPTEADSDRERLRRRFAAAGFAPAHLELRGLRPMQEYLAGYADVDLLLDTFPFTGGTTTAEALWMGVPTLTLSSPSMIGRQGEQIMRASGLPEWVTHNEDEYVARAIEAGRGAAQAPWTAQRLTMRERLRGTPFFDGERFARDWLQAVRAFRQQQLEQLRQTGKRTQGAALDDKTENDTAAVPALPEAAVKKTAGDALIKKLNGLRRFFYRSNLSRLARDFGSDKEGAHFYAQHYQQHFQSRRRNRINLLEIGIGGYENPRDGGHSLRMWKAYFPRGNIFGIDIHDKKCIDEKRIKTFRGSQSDGDFLRKVAAEIGTIDIVVDDGSHYNDDVISTFKTLFPLLSPNGIYVIEDLQTSYWNEFIGQQWGGSSDLKAPHTSMNFLKGLADGLNYEEFLTPTYTPSYFDRNITSVHFYHNLAFIYKGSNNEGSNMLGKRFG